MKFQKNTDYYKKTQVIFLPTESWWSIVDLSFRVSQDVTTWTEMTFEKMCQFSDKIKIEKIPPLNFFFYDISYCLFHFKYIMVVLCFDVQSWSH